MATKNQSHDISSASKVVNDNKQNNVQEIVHEISDKVEHISEKVHHVYDDYEQKVVELCNQLIQIKNNALEKGKNSKLAIQADDLANDLLGKLEKQVETLNNYCQDKSNAEGQIVQNVDKKSVYQRVQHIIITINLLLGVVAQKQWKKAVASPVGLKIIDQLTTLRNQPKVREVLIFTDIAQEFLGDILQNKILIPISQYAEAKYKAIKNQTEVTFSNVKSSVFKTYLPLIISKSETLKNSTIEFYQNKITIQFAQEYYQSNQQLIQKEMKEIYINFMQYQQNVLQRYKAVYISALEGYQKRRSNKLSQMDKTKNETVSVQNSDRDTCDEMETDRQIQANQ